MKSLLILLTLLLLMTVTIPAYAEWNKWDTGLLVLQIADYGQTSWVCNNNYEMITPPQKLSSNTFSPEIIRPLQEMNPILGSHPSQGNINCYFAVLIGCDYLMATRASSKLHKLWDIVEIAAEDYCVTHNWQIGIGFKF